MKFKYLENSRGGEARQLTLFVNTISLAMVNLYDENENEEYKQALRDVGFKMCQLLEPQGIPLNRTPLTAEWLDSNERKEYRRRGLTK